MELPEAASVEQHGPAGGRVQVTPCCTNRDIGCSFTDDEGAGGSFDGDGRAGFIALETDRDVRNG
jgi:hypothetical protein